jgi:N-acyl-D-amino-acid deacylase
MKKILLGFLLFTASCDSEPIAVDVLISGGSIHDGSGMNEYIGNVAIKNDTIFYVGKKKNFIANQTIDATGKVVSPGFINMLSWGYNTLMQDGRSLSDLKQGVTLEVFGEGTSPGPRGSIGSNNYVSFGEAMEKLESSGVSTNIASYLGAATVRIQEIGYANRKASSSEMESMRNIVKLAMMQGAIGIGSSLIYAPGDYADTDELVELSKIASSYGGRYISHMRNEDFRVLEAVDELLEIAERANIPAEIYHLKSSRKPNWHLLDSVIDKVEKARDKGLKITADMYTYPASSTGLTGVIPTWVQEGGTQAWINRMKKPEIRERLFKDIRKELSEQPPEDILMV